MSEGKQFSRRKFMKWAGIGTAGAVLSACAPKVMVVTKEVEVTREVEVETKVEVPVEVEIEVPVEVTVAPEPVIVNVWWQNWGDHFNELMTNIGTGYMDRHPNTIVEWTFNPEWKEKLLTGIAAGTAPDVTYTNMETNTSLANEGAFLPLDAHMVRAGLRREDFVTAMYDASVWDGKLYAVPGGADYYALLWNKSVYEEVGLDPESPPATWDDLVEHSMQILEVDDTGAIQRLGWLPNTWADPLWMWADLLGGSWFDYATSTVTASLPENIEALEWMKSYVAGIGVNQLTAFDESSPDFWSSGNSFASKKTAIRFDGFWTYDSLDAYAPDIDYGVAFFPTPNGTVAERKNYGVLGWMVAIPTGAAEPNAAWDFVKYGFIDNAGKMGCETLNGNSIISQMDSFEQCVTDRLGADNRLTADFHVFVETGLAATRYWPAMPANSLYEDELHRAYGYVVRGEKGAEAALQEVEQTVQAELDRILQD